MALAALRTAMMLPRRQPRAPGRARTATPMEIAAAAPEIPWTDLANSLVPNGSTLDYAVDSSYDKRPFGVMKQSLRLRALRLGLAASNFSPVGTDPSADVNGWFAALNAGSRTREPAGPGIIDEVTEFHSSYYIDHSTPPSPLLISNGFTDDLFPVDEAVRFYNRTRDQYPGADISMFHIDYGHHARPEQGRRHRRAPRPPGGLVRLLPEGRRARSRPTSVADARPRPARAGRRRAARSRRRPGRRSRPARFASRRPTSP